MIVTAHIKFGLYSNFLDSMLQAEDQRLPGESIEEGTIRVYRELEKTVVRLKTEAEAMRGQIIHDTIQGANRDFPPIGPPNPAVINIQDEKPRPMDTLTAIKTAPTLEELKTYKTIASLDKSKDQSIYNAYCKRLKELTDPPTKH